MNILISACLLGQYCRYNGEAEIHPAIRFLLEAKNIHLIPVCPEQAGGLATPREPAERRQDKVVTITGEDVTASYHRGAAEAVKLAELFHCRYAVLKERSPSCGSERIYDGTFSHTVIMGDGVAAQYLKKAGVCVIGETDANGMMRLLQTAT